VVRPDRFAREPGEFSVRRPVMSPARRVATAAQTPAVKPIEVTVELKALMRRLKLGRLPPNQVNGLALFFGLEAIVECVLSSRLIPRTGPSAWPCLTGPLE
jgi:hypothetical protein